ncbi:MAG: hypothetical protein CMC96_12940 [Flavobacteriales bacterium]|nr:hypothetical protein [Flavobacteriales bacterium]
MKFKIIIKEKLQRSLVDISRKFSPLKSIIDQMFLDLSVQQLLPDNIVALDLFARNGLWLSKDCEQHSNYLELCEIDEFFYNWSKKSVKANAYNLGDSIAMLRHKKLSKEKYNFILSDNFSGQFGSYTEHIEVFNYLFDFVDNYAVLAFNVVPNCESRIKRYPVTHEQYEDWMIKRAKFYNLETAKAAFIPIENMKLIYTSIFNCKGFNVKYINHLVRNEVVTLMYCVLEKNKE